MSKILKDPLVHFLAAGVALFLIGNAMKPPAKTVDPIIVDREALLSFIQYRSKAFEPNAAAALLDGLDAAARKQIVDDYVREEALAREAETLGLDANDYVIRQRMVQKVEFLAESTAVVPDPNDADLASYYEANRDRYTSPPAATLAHVFISFEGKDRAAARAEAEAMLETLRTAKAGFNDATRYGDRFLFHKNYVDRTKDYIASQLGSDVEQAVFAEDGALDEWRGPYQSQYGEHLIFVTARAPARLASLDEIKTVVKSDLAEERRQQAIDRAIDEMIAKYPVENRLGTP